MSTTLPVHPRTVGEECLCLALKRSARAVSRRYDQAFKPLGLNSGQFSMLAVIAGLAPVSIQVLAERLAMDRTTVTAALKPLQRNGLVQVDVSPTDLRGKDAILTRQGRALLARAMPRWRALQDELAADFPPSTTPTQLLEQLSILS